MNFFREIEKSGCPVIANRVCMDKVVPHIAYVPCRIVSGRDFLIVKMDGFQVDAEYLNLTVRSEELGVRSGGGGAQNLEAPQNYKQRCVTIDENSSRY